MVYENKSGFKCDFGNLKIKEGDLIYCLQIGEPVNGVKVIKVGTTNDILRRCKEHLLYYKKNIKVLWLSPIVSKYTTLRVEDKTKEKWAENYKYIRNDRFEMPETVKKLTIKIRKEYEFSI